MSERRWKPQSATTGERRWKAAAIARLTTRESYSPDCRAGAAGVSGSYAQFYAFGDSITVGGHASNRASTAYIPLLNSALGVTLVNTAVAGDQVADLSRKVYLVAVESTLSTVLIGTNDGPRMTSSAQRSVFASMILAELAWLAIPSTGKIVGTDAAIVYSGTWVTTGSGWIGKYSNTQGSTMTATVSGETIILGFIGWSHEVGVTGTFDLAVDGATISNYSADFNCATTTLNATPTGAWAILISGLERGEHTVVVTLTSATGGSRYVHFEWIAGVDTLDPPSGAAVYVGEIAPHSPTTYNANIQALNVLIASTAAALRAAGLNVHCAPLYDAIDIDLDLYDGVHPLDSGHAKIANAFLDAIADRNVESAAAQMALDQAEVLASAANITTDVDDLLGTVDGTCPTTAATTATVQAADAATLTATTLDADGTNTTVTFGASSGTAQTAAVYAAGYAADQTAEVVTVETEHSTVQIGNDFINTVDVSVTG